MVENSAAGMWKKEKNRVSGAFILLVGMTLLFLPRVVMAAQLRSFLRQICIGAFRKHSVRQRMLGKPSNSFSFLGNNKVTSAAEALRILLEVAQEEVDFDPRVLPYDLSYLFVPATDGKTLHCHYSDSSRPSIQFSRVVLQIPKEGEKTLWESLPLAEKKILIETLKDIFRRGTYTWGLAKEEKKKNPKRISDWEMAYFFATGLANSYFDPEFDELSTPLGPVMREYFRRIIHNSGGARLPWERDLLPPPIPEEEVEEFEKLFDTPRFRNIPLGISPRRLLLAAFKRIDVGLCRDLAQAYAGLLLEIGVPQRQVRLIWGAKGPERNAKDHVFPEVALEENGPWWEINLIGGLSEDGPTQRELYPHGLKEHPRFFERIVVPNLD